MRSRTPGAFSQLSAFASAFLALPVTSRYASDLRFPLGDYQREFLVPGIPENRHRFTAIYRLGLFGLAGWLLLTAFDGSVSFRAPIAKFDDLIIRANLAHIFQRGNGELKGLFGALNHWGRRGWLRLEESDLSIGPWRVPERVKEALFVSKAMRTRCL